MGAIFPITLPHFPRRSTARTQTFQLLLIFEGIHARPKAIVGIADQLLLRQQSVKGLDYQFFLLPDIFEDLLLEDKKSAVNSHVAVVDGMNI